MRPTIFLLLLGLAGESLFGQTLGEITGEVRDPSGGLVSGARVTATNPATGASRTAVTKQAGVYSFPALQPSLAAQRHTRRRFGPPTMEKRLSQVKGKLGAPVTQGAKEAITTTSSPLLLRCS